jgi:hypothetical protein
MYLSEHRLWLHPIVIQIAQSNHGHLILHEPHVQESARDQIGLWCSENENIPSMLAPFHQPGECHQYGQFCH